MLRDGPHVRQEHFYIVAVMFFLVLLRRQAQIFKALAPAVGRDDLHRLRSTALIEGCPYLGDGSPGLDRFNGRLNHRTGRRALQFSEAVFFVGFINIRKISLNIGQTLLLEGSHVLLAGIQQFFRHVRVHVAAHDAVLAQLQSLKARVQRRLDGFLGVAVLKRLDDAALGLNVLELSPDLLLDLLRQRLYRPGTA